MPQITDYLKIFSLFKVMQENLNPMDIYKR